MPELLAPAGGPAAFNAALAAGADAIYCGYGHVFNARRGAESFDAQTFRSACDKAHVAGVRVYVTVNVVVREDEMPNVLALIRRVWLLGADAFIIQDWGLLAQVRRLWPQIECHVSTQANVHDRRGVAWARRLGAERVTLSRELSMAEIGSLALEGVDLECFCHGAICICYSGVCQMSSSVGSRSANRGACAQPCRLPYELVDQDGTVLSDPGRGRPLCPRDFYAFDDLGALCATGVASLKIEGRLKAPDYIYAVVAAYRSQLDDLRRGERPSEGELEGRRTRLKRAFNRDFTDAYLQGASGDELMSYERSNNRGELVGAVCASRSYGTVKVRRGGGGGGRERLRTARVAEVDIELGKPVGKGDLLEVRPLTDPSQFLTTYAQDDACAGDVITCKTSRAMDEGSLVRVIRSQEAMDAGARVADAAIPRKRAVRVRVRARQGMPFCVELATEDGVASVQVEGFVVEAARTRPVDADDLVAHVGRMGASAFEPVGFEVEVDEGVGMGFAAVHAVRTQACEALERALLETYADRTLAPFRRGRLGPSGDGVHISVPGHTAKAPATPLICVLAADARSARAALAAGADRVYATPDALASEVWPQGSVALLDEVCREADHGRLDPLVREGVPVAVGNVSELALARDRGALPEVRGCIPVHNLSALDTLADAGACGVWLSAELSLDEIRILAHGSPLPLGVTVYGHARAMTCEHCVLQAANRCVHDCGRCTLRGRSTFLQNEKGQRFAVRTDDQGRSRVYAPQTTDLVPYVGELLSAGVSWLGVDATLLSPIEAAHAVRRLRHALGHAVDPEPGSSTGHLFAPID